MRNAPLTDATIRAMRPPEKGYRILWDANLRGFGCRVSQAGTKAFVYLVESGKPLTLGRWPTMSLSQGRAAAKKLAAEKLLHIRRPGTPRVPFDTAVSDFLKDCERRLRPGTVRLYRHHLTRHFPFGRQALADVEPRQIVRALKALPPSQYEHAVRIGKTFFRWAIREHLIDTSPVERLSAPPGKARERILTPDELRAVWQCARTLRTPFHSITALVALIGARRTEAAGLKWDWVKEDRLEWPPEAVKNGHRHVLPLTDEVRAILDAQRPLSGPEYVFPALRQSRPETTHFNGFGKPLKRFQEECGVEHWSLHTLRHQLSSGMAELQVPLLITERILNHRTGSQSAIARRYDHYSYFEPMREALLTWQRHLTTL